MIKISKPVKLRPELAQQLLFFLQFAQGDGCHLRWAENLHALGGTPAEVGKIVGLLKEAELELALRGWDGR